MTHTEPTTLSTHRASAWTGSGPGNVIRFFNASLSLTDVSGVSIPYLQETIPQLNTDSWRVFPDGRMETTHLLRPGLTWHDGAPLTAADFVLSWRVARTPQLGASELIPTKLMEEVLAVDARTIRVRWNGPLFNAYQGDWPAIAAHILEPHFNQGPLEAFGSLPYWTREYIGAGPYRLDRWEPGAFVEASAFPGHALGAPKIDRIKVTWMGDPNTAVANLLAGDVHASLDLALAFEQAVTLKRQWSAGQVHLEPGDLRYVGVQFRPPYVNPQELLDVRVRRALTHGVNKQAMIDAILNGEGKPAETMVPPYLAYYPEVDRAVAKYPYDPNRAHQLFADAGLTRVTDGGYVVRSGERFSPELRAVASGQTERESLLLGESWRALGIDVRHRMMSQAEDTDREVRSTYPAFSTAKSGSAEDTLMVKLYSANTPLPENRWVGSARTGWRNESYDRLYQVVETSLSQDERKNAVVQAMRIVNDEVPLIPLYHDYGIMARASALEVPISPNEIGVGKIYEWRWK